MRFWEAFGHHLSTSPSSEEELERYRRVGGQVLDVLDQLKQVAVPRAHAYIQLARCLELFADTLVEPYVGSEAKPHLPEWVQNQAIRLYHPIPVMVTAAKQEAIDPGGRRDLDLPWILTGRVLGAEHQPSTTFPSYLAAVKAVLDHVEVFLADLGESKGARLYFAEATTNYESARYLLADGQDMPVATKKSLDDYLWTALAYAVGAAQEACEPGLLGGLDIDTVLEGPNAPTKSSPAAPIQFKDAVQEIARAWNTEGYSRPFEHEHHHHHHHREWND